MSSLYEHLLDRGLDPGEYHVHLDQDNGVATFLLYTLSGQLAGFHTYRPSGIKNTSAGRKQGFTPEDLKYFTRVLHDKNRRHFTTAVFGLSCSTYPA